MVKFTLGFHAEIVPSSAAKMKKAGFPGVTAKSLLPLKTIPVGLPIGVPGIVTLGNT
jgi:hypothetical protein